MRQRTALGRTLALWLLDEAELRHVQLQRALQWPVAAVQVAQRVMPVLGH